MNIIFALTTTFSIIALIFINPDAVLSSMLKGGEGALELTIKLTAVYAVWLGVFKIMEKSKLDRKFARLLRPINKFLFGELPDKANDYISINLSANILGMSGATTPFGIKTITELDKHKNTDYAASMFFVINATSVQLIPSSVLALRSSLNSTSPADIILPTILATLLSTIVGIILVKVFIKKN